MPEEGQRWVALRECMTCGHVGCCDSSPGQHANKHFKETGHPVMQASSPAIGSGAMYMRHTSESATSAWLARLAVRAGPRFVYSARQPLC